MKRKIILISILLLATLALSYFNSNFRQPGKQASVAIVKDIFSYRGEAGKDALTILKQKFSVSQDNSGLVIGIANRKADGAKHEYWAFFVNGKTVNVGPADYQTVDKDLIEWKIEKY